MQNDGKKVKEAGQMIGQKDPEAAEDLAQWDDGSE